MIIAAACWGIATVMSKGALTQVAPLTLLVVQLAISIILLWAIVFEALMIGSIELLNVGSANLSTISISAWTWAAASGIFKYVLAFRFYITGLKKHPRVWQGYLSRSSQCLALADDTFSWASGL
jgi:hypothetical protein